MKLAELQKQIVAKNLDRVLLLYGEEVAIMDIYLNKIYAVTQGDVLRFDSVKEAYPKLVQRRITNNASRVFVVRDDSDFFKADAKEWAKVFNAVESSNDYLILIYSKMDKRSKFYKQNQERLCEFEKLSSSILSDYILKLLPGMSPKDRIHLAEVCECSYSRILLEVDKIKHYASALDERGPEALSVDYGLCYKKLLTLGVIHQPIGDITFLFTDAILTRNHMQAAEYLLQAKAIGESEILTLSVLYNGFKHILMVQGLGRDQSEPSKRTGLTPWQVKMAKEKQGHYSISELVNALKVIRDVEKGIKMGTIDADIAVEYVMVNVM